MNHTKHLLPLLFLGLLTNLLGLNLFAQSGTKAFTTNEARIDDIFVNCGSANIILDTALLLDTPCHKQIKTLQHANAVNIFYPNTNNKKRYCRCSVSYFTFYYTGVFSQTDSIYLNGSHVIPISWTVHAGGGKIKIPILSAGQSNTIDFILDCTVDRPNDPPFQVTQTTGGGLCVVVDLTGPQPPEPILAAQPHWSFSAGISSPLPKDSMFSERGMMYDIGFETPLTNWLGLETNLLMMSNPFQFTAPVPIPESIDLLSTANTDTLKWQHFALLFGPQFQVGKGKFKAQLALQAGLLLSQGPEISFGLDNGSGIVSQENTIASFGGDQAGFAWSSGINFSYTISKHWAVSLGGQFLSSIRDYRCIETKAYEMATQQGALDPDLLSTLPIAQQKFGFQSLNLSLGIQYQFDLCHCP